MKACGIGIAIGKGKGFDSWADRRQYVRKLFAGPVAAAAGRANNPGPVTEREPTGWERMDRSLAKGRLQFNSATADEDWQNKGIAISQTDARRLLDAWLHHEMPGGNNKGNPRAHRGPRWAPSTY